MRDTLNLLACADNSTDKKNNSQKSHVFSHGYPAPGISQTLTTEYGGYILQVCGGYSNKYVVVISDKYVAVIPTSMWWFYPTSMWRLHPTKKDQ